MNRFIPDSWWEILLRPLAMAAPDGNVYVEIMAPDWRFMFALLLAAVLLAGRNRFSPAARGGWKLLALVAVAFAPWMATSGNGRYFLPILLLAGPLCIALVYAQPWTAAARLLCAAGLCVLQAGVAFDTRPWDAWSHAAWQKPPYYEVDIPADLRAQPATYVTITSISYSLVAPQFHPASHWINITAMGPDPKLSRETARAHELFASAQRLYMFVPTVRNYVDKDLLPKPDLMEVMDRHLAEQRLALDRTRPCRMLPSPSMVRFELGADPARQDPVVRSQIGFWICPLRYPVAAPVAAPPDKSMDAIFERIEQSCPRLFPAGAAVTGRTGGGYLRSYAVADMKVYVMPNGIVYYKYWRALNMEPIGTTAEVMAPGFKMDCNNIRGRSGLPWQRTM